jgi:hypothetical protein
MSTPTLSRVTLETLENYRSAATQAVLAYRTGGHRLVGAFNDVLENRVYPRTAKLSVGVTERLNEVRGNVSDIVVKGIDQVARRTEQAIELGSTAAAAQLEKAAEFAAADRSPLVAGSLEAAVRFALPGAKLALAVSGKVAEGANKLADAVGVQEPKKAAKKPAKAAAESVAKTAVKKAAKKTVTKASAAVETAEAAPDTPAAPEAAAAPAAPKAPRARRAVKKAVEADAAVA